MKQTSNKQGKVLCLRKKYQLVAEENLAESAIEKVNNAKTDQGEAF